jgi:hypothetical protein
MVKLRMMILNKLCFTIILLILIIIRQEALYAQDAIPASGGNSAGFGSVASVSFTVGQVNFQEVSGTGGSIAQGVQQHELNILVLLPPKILYFVGEQNQNKMTLNWEAISPKKNVFFQVEKSEDAQNWKLIGTVESSKNLAKSPKYRFLDPETLGSTTYYRLKQTDIEGNTTFSNVISAFNTNLAAQTISIYPNPTLEGVFISMNLSKASKYELFDISGKLLERNEVTEKTYINMSNLPAAQYILKIAQQDVSVKTFKIIKN